MAMKKGAKSMPVKKVPARVVPSSPYRSSRVAQTGLPKQRPLGPKR